MPAAEDTAAPVLGERLQRPHARTTNEKGPEWVNEGTAPGDGHQTGKHAVGYLVCVERLVPLVNLCRGIIACRAGITVCGSGGRPCITYLDQPTDDCAGKATTGCSYSHHQGNTPNNGMETGICNKAVWEPCNNPLPLTSETVQQCSTLQLQGERSGPAPTTHQ